MNKDYYQILNIQRNANSEDIKKAYRKLAHQYHPDKTGGDDKKFKEINEAYQVLSDPKKRSSYDNFGYAYNDGGFRNQDFSNMGGFWDIFGGGAQRNNGGLEDIFDVFSDLFGAGGFTTRQQEDHKGEDIYLEVPVGKKDLGKRKLIEFEVLGPCKECEATGVAKGYKIITCKVCGGSGQLKNTSQTGFGIFTKISICHACHGKGKMPEKQCPKCDGKGRAKTRRKIEIHIPESIDNSYSIVLPKQGNSGVRSRPPGDLVINLKLK